MKEGLLIVMILLMESVIGKESFGKTNISGVLFHWWVHLFQEVLWYNCWISKEEYDCKTLKTAEDIVCLLLATFKAVLNRTEGYDMKIQKFHQQIHGPANIDYFGSPKNVDSRPCEKNLKMYVKAPGWAMQKWSETFHQQCGNRMYESLVTQKALIDHLGEDIITVQDFEIRKEPQSSITEQGIGVHSLLLQWRRQGIMENWLSQ
jgi:hypothetical protein